jgi:DNA-binding response OmpR family regulator
MRPTSRGTIVVVERSAPAQELIEHALREAGHRVLVTRNPLEALELGRRIRIDALVAVVATLDDDGPGLVPQLRTIQPLLPVLYLAGREDADKISALPILADNISALPIPFSLDELEEAVAAALGGS